MTVLIIGYPDSGKSKIAEDMAMELSAPGERIYLATMIPYGDEGRERVERHRAMRAGKGFVTMEVPYDVYAAVMETGDAAGRTLLLECVSNLVANEMFERRTAPEAAVDKITEDVEKLSSLARDLIIVSNHYEISDVFDEETRLYSKTLDAVNEKLKDIADSVITL